MSSFTIDKKEYIKAAGLVAGLAKELQLWIFDFKKYRKMEESDFYEAFVECFEMNALSVQEQYKDHDLFTDGNTYLEDFKKYMKHGTNLAITGEGLKEAFLELRQFFSGCIYQTEKPEYMFKMQMLFDRIIVELSGKVIKGYEPESWGKLENCECKRNVTRIM